MYYSLCYFSVCYSIYSCSLCFPVCISLSLSVCVRSNSGCCRCRLILPKNSFVVSVFTCARCTLTTFSEETLFHYTTHSKQFCIHKAIFYVWKCIRCIFCSVFLCPNRFCSIWYLCVCLYWCRWQTRKEIEIGEFSNENTFTTFIRKCWWLFSSSLIFPLSPSVSLYLLFVCARDTPKSAQTKEKAYWDNPRAIYCATKMKSVRVNINNSNNNENKNRQLIILNIR